ncbi:MCE family protein [Rhodococcoides corynebacterioides]|uniref:MCE family protein n=1 Tax=Rhodococcoides corynebacterioides TaxID=53972 RepID=A0ABS7PAD5_9NOCA|nr:MCE family protein [Rhodococcus corynebacterioides]MBY6368121.1 MCE family protein [Rhodococcus corynebacterioides]MBY6409606.1 MCE family protein [Rhodococcus corynebacterioides]
MVKRRLAGLAFFLAVAGFVGFTTAQYARAFDDSIRVRLVLDNAGNALPQNADVKVRGVLVGDVRETTTENGRVVASLALNPFEAERIPSSVTARLLPKTLFGERYVALQIPENPGSTGLTDGAEIEQDRSGNAVEVGRVLDSVLPLLEAIPPEDLSSTLGALASALDGNGEKLGRTLDRLDTIVTELAAEVPTIRADLRGLADLSQTYSTAAPDLVAALDDLRIPTGTVVERQAEVDTLLRSAASSSGSLADLVAANAESVVSFAADSRQAVELLAEFSPTIGCVLPKFAALYPEAQRILGVNEAYPGARGTINFVNPRGRYLPNQDEPRLFDDRPGACYEDVTTPGKFFPQYPGSGINDGSYAVPSRNPGPATVATVTAPQLSPLPASYAGSQIERDTLAVVYGEGSGLDPRDVPGWTTLVGAPALRGSDIRIR